MLMLHVGLRYANPTYGPAARPPASAVPTGARQFAEAFLASTYGPAARPPASAVPTGARQFAEAFLASRLAISPSIPLRASSERNDER